MSDTIVALISALGTGLLSLVGVYMANRKSSALIAYRLEVLEKKVDKHNGLIDRMYKAEGRLDAIEQALGDIKDEIKGGKA